MSITVPFPSQVEFQASQRNSRKVIFDLIKSLDQFSMELTGTHDELRQCQESMKRLLNDLDSLKRKKDRSDSNFQRINVSAESSRIVLNSQDKFRQLPIANHVFSPEHLEISESNDNVIKHANTDTNSGFSTSFTVDSPGNVSKASKKISKKNTIGQPFSNPPTIERVDTSRLSLTSLNKSRNTEQTVGLLTLSKSFTNEPSNSFQNQISMPKPAETHPCPPCTCINVTSHLKNGNQSKLVHISSNSVESKSEALKTRAAGSKCSEDPVDSSFLSTRIDRLSLRRQILASMNFSKEPRSSANINLLMESPTDIFDNNKPRKLAHTDSSSYMEVNDTNSKSMKSLNTSENRESITLDSIFHPTSRDTSPLFQRSKERKNVEGSLEKAKSFLNRRRKKTQTPVEKFKRVPPNPNQIGEIILNEGQRDYNWFIYRVVRKALQVAIPYDSTHDKPGKVNESEMLALRDYSAEMIMKAVAKESHFFFHASGNDIVQELNHLPGKPGYPLNPYESENTDSLLFESLSQLGVSNSCARPDEVCVTFYAPVLFAQMRKILKLNNRQFHDTLLDPKVEWRISKSPGKSQSIMLLFGNYMIKSVRDGEMEFLRDRFLPSYASYVQSNSSTFLSRFFSLLSIKWMRSNVRTYFILMNNVFSTPQLIQRLYDLKGSTVGRSATGGSGEYTCNGALLLKDNDVHGTLFHCGQVRGKGIIKQIKRDTSFLAGLNIVDYSCLIGVRWRRIGLNETIRLPHAMSQAVFSSSQGGNKLAISHDPQKGEKVTNSIDSKKRNGKALITEEKNTEVPSFEVDDSETDDNLPLFCPDGGIISIPLLGKTDTHTAYEETYYLGIIDLFQTYNAAKKFENFAKGLVSNRWQISVIPSKEYAKRICDMMERLID